MIWWNTKKIFKKYYEIIKPHSTEEQQILLTLKHTKYLQEYELLISHALLQHRNLVIVNALCDILLNVFKKTLSLQNVFKKH